MTPAVMPGLKALPRSYLYVPATAEAKVAKALTRGADALIIDLEDAVPHPLKGQARTAALAWLQGQDVEGATELWVRVNAGRLRAEDVAALAGTPTLTGLVLAKVQDVADVQAVAAILEGAGDRTTQLMPLIETAGALLDARAIAAGPRVLRLQVGEVDLAGDLGMQVGEDEAEMLAVRTAIVVASRAAAILPPVGPVSLITEDRSALALSTRRLRRLGYLGRACIHPAQIDVVHETFRPQPAEVREAHEVIRLLDTAQAEGRGVVLDGEGRLVDEAVLAGARRVVALAARQDPA